MLTIYQMTCQAYTKDDVTQLVVATTIQKQKILQFNSFRALFKHMQYLIRNQIDKNIIIHFSSYQLPEID